MTLSVETNGGAPARAEEIFRRRPVQVGDRTVYVREAGTAREHGVVWLLNAFFMSLDFWSVLAAHLSQRYLVISPELCPPESSDMNPLTLQVEELTHLIEAYGGRPRHIIGWCTGAGLAVKAAARLRDRLSSLTLLNGAYVLAEYSGKHTEFETTMPQFMSKAVENRAAAQPVYMLFQSASKREVSGASYRGFTSAVYDTFEQFMDYARIIHSYNASPIDGELGALSSPVLAVTGDRDTTAHMEKTKHVAARIRRSELVVCAGMDHYGLHGDARVVGLVEEFLARAHRPGTE